MSAKVTLKQLLDQGTVVAPCVYDCLSAAMVKEVGFQAMCLSGSELSGAFMGYPDIGIVTMSELEDSVRRIARFSPLPMIVDIDTGFGNEINTVVTCQRIAAAGAMAVHLEDQTSPKRCGHLSGKSVIPFDDYISKVRAAVDALKGTDCLLIARTDAYFVNGKEDAIARATAAIEAGADLTLVEGPRTIDDIAEIGRRVPGKKMFGMASSCESPCVTAEQLTEMGYNLITMHYTASAAMWGMKLVGEQCFKRQDDIYVTEHPEISGGGRKYFLDKFGLNEWLSLGAKYNSKVKLAGAIQDTPLEKR